MTAYRAFKIVIWLLALGIFEVGSAFVSWLSQQQSDLAIAIVTASATVFLSVVSLVLSNLMEQRNAIRQDIREKKTPVCEKMISTFFTAMHAASSDAKEEVSSDDLESAVAEFIEEVVVWGSDEVIVVYNDFQRAARKERPPTEIMTHYEDLLFAIRRDLGHKNRGLGRSDLLRLFITDLDQALEQVENVDSEQG